MLPLSAIRQMMPALGSLPTAKVGGQIPLAELQQLATGTTSGTVATPGLRPAAAPTDFGIAAPAHGGGSFSNVLGRLVQEVNGKQMAAGNAVRQLQSGQDVSIHQTMIAIEEAGVAFQLMVEVRNKLLEAYQELMRMQV